MTVCIFKSIVTDGRWYGLEGSSNVCDEMSSQFNKKTKIFPNDCLYTVRSPH